MSPPDNTFSLIWSFEVIKYMGPGKPILPYQVVQLLIYTAPKIQT